jgi:hypothetical protein
LKAFSSFEEKQFQHFQKDLIGPLLAFNRSGYTGKFPINFEIKCKRVLKGFSGKLFFKKIGSFFVCVHFTEYQDFNYI